MSVECVGNPIQYRRDVPSRLVTGADPGPPLTRKQEGPRRGGDPGELVRYAAWMSPPATLVMWFQLRSPELAEDFERLMTEDRDNVRGSLDTMSDWRLMRPADVPGQSIGQADYVLIAEIAEVERWEQQATEHVQRLADDLAHLVSNRGCSSCVPSFDLHDGRWPDRTADALRVKHLEPLRGGSRHIAKRPFRSSIQGL